MTKIYFFAFLALLVFVAVSAQEEEGILDLQSENSEKFFSVCDRGIRVCDRLCKKRGKKMGFCGMDGLCKCLGNFA
ncbi:drosomycin-like [Vespula squamosa]|uniref:Drosomycin-like n=1 Tax=Vespula squamosa TaxID=30214 RepID=A0ABD2APB2_VESSQ